MQQVAGRPSWRASAEPEADSVVGAILTSASLAAMDIADGATGTPAVALLEETTGMMRGVPPRGEPRTHRSIPAPAEIR